METARPALIVTYVRYLLLTFALMLCSMPLSALAIQWEPLARTGRHDVAIDINSIRITTLSRVAVWLRFIPLGEQQRRQAATEYNQKSYRHHLEYYEIDCSEQNAVLGLVDILGPANKRLARTKGGSIPDLIIPGSVLDLALHKVCPALEETANNDEDEIKTSDGDNVPPEESELTLSEEKMKLIAETVKKTEIEPQNIETWRELGNAYFDADMPVQAIAAYNQALKINPDDTNILNDQGAMYRQIGNFTRALSNFDKAHKVDSYNLESLYNSGYVLAFDLNQIDKAIDLWRRYLVLDQTSETSRQVKSFIDRYGNSNENNTQK